jgi:hypothetical protein
MKHSDSRENCKSRACWILNTDIVDITIHPVVCQISDFHRNSDFWNSQKLDPFQIPAKKSGQNMVAL